MTEHAARALRIAVLGDSSSAGIGDGIDIYPYQLFERLRESGSVSVETWASPGLTSADAAKLYRHNLAGRSLDLLIVYLGNNEGSRSRYKGTYRPIRNWAGETFRFRATRKPPPAADKRMHVFSAMRASHGVATTPADFYFNLRSIIGAARREGTEIVLINPVANARFPPGLGSPNASFYRYVGLGDAIGPELIAVDPASEDLVQGIRLQVAGRLADAICAYERIAAENEYCFQIARNNVAVAHYENGQQELAEEVLSAALDKDPFDRAVLLYNLGRIKRSNQLLDEAYAADASLYRVKQPYRDVVSRLGEEFPIHVLDLAGRVDAGHFVDYCHLTRDGHRILADWMEDFVAARFAIHADARTTPQYRAVFPSPDYLFDSGADLAAYYQAAPPYSESEIVEACGNVLAADANIADSTTGGDGRPLMDAVRRTIVRALRHPAVTGHADIGASPVRFAHEVGSFPEFYGYRLLRSYLRAVVRFGHVEAWLSWRGDLPVRSADAYERLVFARPAGAWMDEEPDLSPGRRDRVLDRVEEKLRDPAFYADRTRERLKTIIYWYTRESFRFGTQSRASMLYDRVALEELAEAVAVAWIIDRVAGQRRATERLTWYRDRINALVGVHERFAGQLVIVDDQRTHDEYAEALAQHRRVLQTL